MRGQAKGDQTMKDNVYIRALFFPLAVILGITLVPVLLWGILEVIKFIASFVAETAPISIIILAYLFGVIAFWQEKQEKAEHRAYRLMHEERSNRERPRKFGRHAQILQDAEDRRSNNEH